MSEPYPTILLIGLDASLAVELGIALSGDGNRVYERPFVSARQCADTIEMLNPDLVFCPSERNRYQPLLAAISQRERPIPVVIVSRLPEVSDWLDALDAGASDYCAAPFEARQVRWILDSKIDARRRMCAAA